MTIKMWYEILEEIKLAKGKEKLEILKANKDVKHLEDVLKFTFDPLITTGISIKKWNKVTFEQALENEYYSSSNIIDIINFLLHNNTGKDSDVLELKSSVWYIENDLEQNFTEQLILKDMPIGISAKTINKAFPNLIFEYTIMKSTKYEMQDLSDKDISITLKIDGNNATCFNLEEETFFLSSSGRRIEGFEHLIRYYRECIPMGYVYFGELLMMNSYGLNHGELFRITNGIINSKKEEKTSIKHVLFDAISHKDYQNKENNESYSERINRLRKFVGFGNIYTPHPENYVQAVFNELVETVPNYNNLFEYKFDTTDNNEKIAKGIMDVTSKGLEGLMINLNDAPYEFKRSKNIYKVKEFHTMDVMVVDTEEHIRGGKVGAIKMAFKGNVIGIGSITEKQRNEWWEDPSKIIGKIVEIGYFRETTDKNGNPSLRFPTLIRVRHDKTYEDISYD